MTRTPALERIAETLTKVTEAPKRRDAWASLYPYVTTKNNSNDIVMVPNPDIHCFADELA